MEQSYVRPRGAVTASIGSKEALEHGVFHLNVVLPAPEPRAPLSWFGFELDDLFMGGVAHFMCDWSSGRLRAYAGDWPEPLAYDLTRHLPADYAAARRLHSVRATKRYVIHEVDGAIRTITITMEGSEHRAIREGGLISSA